jgi:hypothetical protein
MMSEGAVFTPSERSSIRAIVELKNGHEFVRRLLTMFKHIPGSQEWESAWRVIDSDFRFFEQLDRSRQAVEVTKIIRDAVNAASDQSNVEKELRLIIRGGKKGRDIVYR